MYVVRTMLIVGFIYLCEIPDRAVIGILFLFFVRVVLGNVRILIIITIVPNVTLQREVY